MANTIQDKLAYLEETKGLIKEAIVAKGVEVTDTDTFRSYANKIEAIQAGGGGAVNLPDGTKFVNSTFTTISGSIISYLETQTDLSGIFENCTSLTTVPSFDASKATDMLNMFNGCGSLQTVSQINTPNVTNMNQMFNYCEKLQTVLLFGTSNVTNMNRMFYNCRLLQTVSQFDTSKVNNMGFMFAGCTSLTTVPLLNVSSVTDMSYMFGYCISLTSVPQFDTSSVKYMGGMFSDCTNLTTVPLLNVSSVNFMDAILTDCTSLTNLGGFTGLKENLDLRYSYDITVDSVMNVINNAADMTSEPKTLVLKQYVLNKLSEEQIATASAKGWNIAAR